MNKLLLPLAVAAACTPLCAQNAGTCTPVTGVVQDASAGLIPGASVVLDGAAPIETGPDGRFRLPCVAAGQHQLKVAYDGFAPVALPFKTPHAAALDLTLTPATTTSIDVDADAAETPSVNSVGPAQTISGKQLQQLADDPDDLLRELQQMSATMGGNPANATISVDGFQDSSVLPPKSSIAYIKVNPDLFSSEYREPPFGEGGRVEIYTKPGQKAYHGALFTTNGSAWENARDPFSSSKAAIGKQRYGFELQGPIRKTGSDFSLGFEFRDIANFAVVDATTLDAAGNPTHVSANVATPQRLWLPTARVDWQLSPRNTFIASYTGNLDSTKNNGVGGTTLAEAGYDATSFDHTLRLSNITTISSHLMHETRASFRYFGANDTPQSTAPQISVSGYFTGGGASVGNLSYRRFRLEVDDDAILTLAHHTLKVGTQIFFNDDHRNLTNGFNGSYIFTSAAQYASKTPFQFSGVSGSPQVNYLQANAAFFIEDDWKVSHGVMISAGVRYYLQNDPLLAASATPRLGIQWAPGKDPKWTLHAHIGTFADNVLPNSYAEVLREDGVHRVTSLVYNPVYGAPLTGGAQPIYSARRFASPISNTTYAIYNVGGSRQLPFGFNLSGELGYGRLWNYLRSRNVNQPLDGTANGPRPIAPNLNLYEVQNSGQGRLDFLFGGIENHAWKRATFFVGAVHINQFDDTDDSIFFTPQNAYSDKGEFARRSENPPWQVFGNATFTLPSKLSLSTNLNASGDSRFNITTGTDDNHDGVFNDRPQYAAPGDLNAVQTPYGLLSSTGTGGILGRNRGVMPWTIHLDANLQRAFKLTRNAKAEHQQTLTLNIRSSNLLNHTNVTGVQSVLGSPTFGQAYSADNGRRIEAGARFSF